MITTTDLFCGAGGSTTGAQTAGIHTTIAANHWPKAIQTHALNHPHTDHDCADISQVNPRRYPHTDILWGSPECTNHSIAKGISRHHQTETLQRTLWNEPTDNDAAIRSRATMWDIPRFAEHHQYPIVITENVVDAAKWVLFPAWLQAMHALGYQHHTIWLNSMHATLAGPPAPQSRDRMYVFFWKDTPTPNFDLLRPTAICPTHGPIKAQQVFKNPTSRWGRYRAQYTYQCPQCDHVVEPPVRPASTVIDWSNPGTRIGDRKRPLAEKTMRRIQAGIDKYWNPKGTLPLIINHLSGSDASRSAPACLSPLRTLAAGGNHESALQYTPLIMRNQSLLIPYYGNGYAAPTSNPHRTLTTTDRYALTTSWTTPRIEDTYFRMLTPDEVKLGMAFPTHYQAVGTAREQVRMWGNAVTPPAARDLYTIAAATLTA